jgi:hypothetical protein
MHSELRIAADSARPGRAERLISSEAESLGPALTPVADAQISAGARPRKGNSTAMAQQTRQLSQVLGSRTNSARVCQRRVFDEKGIVQTSVHVGLDLSSDPAWGSREVADTLDGFDWHRVRGLEKFLCRDTFRSKVFGLSPIVAKRMFKA